MKKPENTDSTNDSSASWLGPDVLPNRVCVVDGYGVSIYVERRHLVVRDGAGAHRRERRFSRVGHNLDRLVVIGCTGSITLEATRWLDRVGIALVHLDRDHRLVSGTIRPGLDDARLRRAQARAADEPYGLVLAAHLLGGKIDGQASNLRTAFGDEPTAVEIDRLAGRVRDATTMNEVRDAEARAAHLYFDAWIGQISFRWAPSNRNKVPEHWQRFSRRHSPLAAASSIRAADPINATLNYVYALAEVECRLACLVLGLDPGLGIIHKDKKGRDSLALDLIEPVRPIVDAYVLELSRSHLFRADDFIERDDGHCRILPPLTHHLASTLALWREAVAPWAEQVRSAVSDASPYVIGKATPLTSTLRRERSTAAAAPRRRGTARKRSTPRPAVASLPPACVECGQFLDRRDRSYCTDCLAEHRARSRGAARDASRAMVTTPAGRAMRSRAISAAKSAARNDRASALGLSPSLWDELIAPNIASLSLQEIMDATGHKVAHASRLKRGLRVANPKHWPALCNALAAHITDVGSR